MANAYSVLGQSNPSATTLTDAYTVASSTEAVISTIIVCNRGSAATSYRLSVAVDGAADSNEQYIAYDIPIHANDTHAWQLGITIDATDKIRVYAAAANLSFNIFGVEIT